VLLHWLRRNKAVYFDNATSRRDYRVQLRGNRSIWLFAFYLLTLISIAMFVYSQTNGMEQMSISEAQRQLRDFYSVVIVLLGSLITLVAPALTATAVISERQRQSLDLVFSAPTSPKYYLVGKMIASYRFTWMLLVLSLPVTAACVVLGGASWQEVLVAYFLLSAQALLITSVALMMSTVAQKPISAITTTYGLVIIYLVLTASVSATSLAASLSGSGGRESFFGVCLNPFFVGYTADTYSVIWGVEVSNWILAGLFCLAVAKFCILAAGSLLAPYGGKEVISLRIHGLIYTFVIALYVGYTAASASSTIALVGPGPGPLTSGASSKAWLIAGISTFYLLLPLTVCLPLFTCFGFDGERRLYPNGTFRLRSAFAGTPAGGLPYLILIVLSASLGTAAGAYWQSAISPGLPFFAYALFTVGFWLFFWAVGRLTSSLFMGVKTARGLMFAVFATLVILPLPFLSAISSMPNGPSLEDAWEFYILRPLGTTSDDRYVQAAIYGLILSLLAFVISRWADGRVARRAIPKKVHEERPLTTA
jgi:ABC-type transport system involved in multi-copper enzyme maturation permease subunit